MSFVSTSCVLDSGSESPTQLHVSTTTQNFRSGRSLCEETFENVSIISIHSTEQNARVIELVQQVGTETAASAYIGLFDAVFDDTTPTNDVSRFAWLDGSAFDFGTTASVEPWDVGEPNNFGNETQENCVIVSVSTGLWVDRRCSQLQAIVCSTSCVLESSKSLPLPISVIGGVAAGVFVLLAIGTIFSLHWLNKRAKQKFILKEIKIESKHPNDIKLRNMRRPSGIALSKSFDPMLRQSVFSHATNEPPTAFKEVERKAVIKPRIPLLSRQFGNLSSNFSSKKNASFQKSSNKSLEKVKPPQLQKLEIKKVAQKKEVARVEAPVIPVRKEFVPASPKLRNTPRAKYLLEDYEF